MSAFIVGSLLTRWVRNSQQDHTANHWLTAFQETGTEIMRMTADNLAKLQVEDPAEFEKVMMVRPCYT